nr:MAG TPA: hypothetical protein [Caudoviricetes sp.]
MATFPRKDVLRLLFLPNDKNFRNTTKAAVLPRKRPYKRL